MKSKTRKVGDELREWATPGVELTEFYGNRWVFGLFVMSLINMANAVSLLASDTSKNPTELLRARYRYLSTTSCQLSTSPSQQTCKASIARSNSSQRPTSPPQELQHFPRYRDKKSIVSLTRQAQRTSQNSKLLEVYSKTAESSGAFLLLLHEKARVNLPATLSHHCLNNLPDSRVKS